MSENKTNTPSQKREHPKVTNDINERFKKLTAAHPMQNNPLIINVPEKIFICLDTFCDSSNSQSTFKTLKNSIENFATLKNILNPDHTFALITFDQSTYKLHRTWTTSRNLRQILAPIQPTVTAKTKSSGNEDDLSIDTLFETMVNEATDFLPKSKEIPINVARVIFICNRFKTKLNCDLLKLPPYMFVDSVWMCDEDGATNKAYLDFKKMYSGGVHLKVKEENLSNSFAKLLGHPLQRMFQE